MGTVPVWIVSRRDKAGLVGQLRTPQGQCAADVSSQQSHRTMLTVPGRLKPSAEVQAAVDLKPITA